MCVGSDPTVPDGRTTIDLLAKDRNGTDSRMKLFIVVSEGDGILHVLLSNPYALKLFLYVEKS